MTLPKHIRIKYLDPGMPRLQLTPTGDWCDLRANQDYTYKAGDFFLVNLGVIMELPSGYEAHIVPRSSTFKNYGVIQTNSQGVVDNSYRGEKDIWFWPVLAMRDGEIKKFDRVCQFRIVQKMEPIVFTEVETMSGTDRGGHGSSGVK